ncbi:MAG: hypothetical protein WD009_08480 [Phycisphaeraceae bacterium]
MKSLSQFIVRTLDLLEAEGRAAKRATFRLVAAILLLLIAGAFVLAAAGLFGGALYVLLSHVLGAAGALAVLGAVMLLAAFILLVGATWLRDKKAGVR